MDIRNLQGNSVMVRMTEDELLEQEGCLTKFVYEKEQDLLYCFTEGIYTMCIKIYAANGGMAVYEFRIFLRHQKKQFLLPLGKSLRR